MTDTNTPGERQTPDNADIAHLGPMAGPKYDYSAPCFDLPYIDLRATTSNPYPDGPERELYEALNRHSAVNGYLCSEEAVFAWLEQLMPGAAVSFCRRAERLSKAIAARSALGGE
jgi:hypothetical protein